VPTPDAQLLSDSLVAVRLHYTFHMKTSTIPSVRVEPELREQLEQVLQDGETLSSFVEKSVRDTVRRRLEQAEFVARGIASLEAAKRSGRYVRAVRCRVSLIGASLLGAGRRAALESRLAGT
jgi:predicted transcriptional regulator